MPRSSEPIQAVWFKRDLRVFDHAALAQAAARGPVLPLYIAEPEAWRQPDASLRQWAFVQECLADLKEQLAKLGLSLCLRLGEAVPVLNRLQEEVGFAALWSHQETGNLWSYRRDQAVGAWCRDKGIVWEEPRQGGTIRRLGSRDGWARRWEAFMGEEPWPRPRGASGIEVASDPWPDAARLGLLADPCPGRQTGGRSAGLALLNSFLSGRGQDYRRAMSSPVTAFDSCSRLSAHLAWGSLSLREVTQAARGCKASLGETPEEKRFAGSLASFIERLHWRCHFIQKLEDAPEIEERCLHPAYERLRPDLPDPAKLAAWQKGETGLPFLDACMRALTQTGWMNFRMRAMLMATASYHLWLPWRETGLHLARLFTDYEPGIHWPQTQMQSGTTGINTVRLYNPVKQGRDQDPEGRFVRQWVPELRDVPDAHLQEPWRWEAFAARIGAGYPRPIVDHIAAAQRAKALVYAVRGQEDYRAAADAIQARHGSRKSGMRLQRRRPKTQQPDLFEG